MHCAAYDNESVRNIYFIFLNTNYRYTYNNNMCMLCFSTFQSLHRICYLLHYYIVVNLYKTGDGSFRYESASIHTPREVKLYGRVQRKPIVQKKK